MKLDNLKDLILYQSENTNKTIEVYMIMRIFG